MGTEKFTPGPWYAHEHLKPGYDDCFGVLNAPDVPEEAHDLKIICDFSASAQETLTDIANMHLIACAPEMYDFIKKTVNLMCWANHPELAEEGEKLLAKARGERQ